MRKRSQIHIQHVLLSLEPGGLENGVVNVVNHIDPARFRSSVCCLKLAGEFSTRLKAEDVTVHQMNWRGGLDILLPLRLAKLFRSTNVDIVHTRNAAAFFYGFLGAKLAGVPAIVHSEHGRTFAEKRVLFLAQRAMFGCTDAVFSVSSQLRRDLVANLGVPSSSIEVIYNGVNLVRFMPTTQNQLRRQLGIKSDEFIVGSVGRLVEVKNYSLLLRAVHQLRDDKVVVLMIGDGPERTALQVLAQSLGLAGRVHFLGHRDDVSAILSAIDVFVLPSLSEGMSNTLLEAMATGIPVVASNVGGNPEIIDDGLDGLLFESGNAGALCDTLKKFLTDTSFRLRLGEAGRERVFKEFSMEAMISNYERLYQKIFDRYGAMP